MRFRAPVHVGTSGWQYGHWRGPFYPDDLKAPGFLPYYAARFTTVEINNSFYRLPSEQALLAWRNASPPGFLFAVKGSRFITHMKKLKDPERTLPPFLERIALLGEKLGPILFQLPPRWHFDAPRLAAFLAALPGNTKSQSTGGTGVSPVQAQAKACGYKKCLSNATRYKYRYTLELRDGSWINESFNGKLRDELLNGEIFYTLEEAQILIERWRREYNTVRPHSALGYRPPAPEAIQVMPRDPGYAMLRQDLWLDLPPD